MRKISEKQKPAPTVLPPSENMFKIQSGERVQGKIERRKQSAANSREAVPQGEALVQSKTEYTQSM